MAEWSAFARRVRVPVGFAFAVVFIILAKPDWRSIILGCAVAIPGLVVRALASGHVEKNERLTTTGPYSYTRNPLYLGSLILAAGFAVAARSVWIALGMALIFIVIYLPVIRSEETFLGEHFPEFADYARRVPRLLPRWKADRNPGTFSAQLYWEHREYNAALGALGLMAVLAAKVLWH
jgi:protein-S-isoprenylcysteine O-methyltransferase Ste14